MNNLICKYEVLVTIIGKLIMISFLTLVLCIGVVSGVGVLLSTATSVALYPRNMTRGRCSVSIPRVCCVGGSVKCPNTLDCIKKGSDGIDTQWECITYVAPRLKFGETTMVCERYEYPNDDYILSGNCGIEYSLNWTYVKSDDKSSSVGMLLWIMLLISLSHICCGDLCHRSHITNYFSGWVERPVRLLVDYLEAI